MGGRAGSPARRPTGRSRRAESHRRRRRLRRCACKASDMMATVWRQCGFCTLSLPPNVQMIRCGAKTVHIEKTLELICWHMNVKGSSFIIILKSRMRAWKQIHTILPFWRLKSCCEIRAVFRCCLCYGQGGGSGRFRRGHRQTDC